MKKIIVIAVMITVSFVMKAKEVDIVKRGGKKSGGEVTYYNTRYNETEEKVLIRCSGRGNNQCPTYSPTPGSTVCNATTPPYTFPIDVCIIEEMVCDEIDAGNTFKKGIYGGSIYWTYTNGEYDSTEEVYSYDLIISDQPLW
jgi:hypothetical protein